LKLQKNFKEAKKLIKWKKKKGGAKRGDGSAGKGK